MRPISTRGLGAVLSLVLSVFLGGCSYLLDTNWTPSQDPEPDSADVILLAEKIDKIFPTLKLPGAPEISRVRRTEAVSLANWIICLRNNVPENSRTYAIYVKKNEIVDYRLAVLMDRCEQESFVPLIKAPDPKKLGQRSASGSRII